METIVMMSCTEVTERIDSLHLSQKPKIDEAAAAAEISFDTITEILSWLPVKSLLRFKCVRKQWHDLLLDSKFIALHMARVTQLQFSYQKNLTQILNTNQSCDEDLFEHISDRAGLVLENSVANSQVYRIRNFATHQVVYLPHLPNGIRKFDFVFDSITGGCKVGGFLLKKHVVDGNLVDICIKILSVGKDDQWRTLELPKQNDHVTLCYKFNIRSGEGLKECAAQLVEIIRDGNNVTKLQIKSFDVWSEGVTVTMLPQEAFLDVKRVSCLYWDCHAAVAHKIEETLDIWVLENFQEHKWRNVIVSMKFLKDDPRFKDGIFRPLYIGCDDYLYLKNVEDNKIVAYDMKRGRVDSNEGRLFEIEKNRIDFTKMRKPSLVTLKGMNYEE